MRLRIFLRLAQVASVGWAGVAICALGWAQPAAPPGSTAVSTTATTSTSTFVAGTTTSTVPAGSTAAFDVRVIAPPDVAPLLQDNLSLYRYRAVADLDDAELARVMKLADADARELLGAQGYFNPEIRLRVDGGGAGQRRVVTIDVAPGVPTTIAAVDISFAGDIERSTDEGAAAQRRAITDGWGLKPGARFTQDAWAAAKTDSVRRLVQRRYPAGRLTSSLADVDAAANRAGLGLKLDSGALFRYGPMRVTGIERYDPVIAPRLARLPEGAVYDQEQIQRAQLRLAASGYFDSAFIAVDPADPDPARATLQTSVKEATLQKVVLGAGFTTDSGPRLSLEHRHNRVPGLGGRAVTQLQIDRKAPFFQSELTAIPDERGWRWGTLLRVERLDDGELVTQAQRLRFGRSKADDQIDRNVYLQYDRANVQPRPGSLQTPEDTGDGTAMSGNYVWTGRYFDRYPSASSGWGAGFELGGGVTLSGTKSPFQRTVVRALWLRPTGSGRVQLRGEAGAVLARESARVPSTQLFRTGGDTSVRGYGYRDIGAERNGVVGPGRYLAVTSVEYQFPVGKPRGEIGFEGAVFIDAGAVADRVNELRPQVGVGAGVRVKSPLGPLQVDLAWGVKPKRPRLHVTLGFSF